MTGKMFTQVDYHYGRQGHDGTAHLAYYCPIRLLSFVWDGKGEAIEVHYGGYGEPVEWLIPAPVLVTGNFGEMVQQFENHCYQSLSAWDEEIYDPEHPDQYGYQKPYPHCATVEKLNYPKGMKVSG